MTESPRRDGRSPGAGQALQHLAQIDAAMLRLAQGRYGQCERCGEPIGAARLAARPVTTMCITCAR